MGSAGQGELVDVGAMGAGPVAHMMDLAAISRHVASGCAAATIAGVQDNSLPRCGQAFAVIQRQGFALIENGEVMVGMAGQTDHVGHR